MTQAERDRRRPPTRRSITTVRPRQRAVRRRLDPGQQHARGVGRHGGHASRRRRSRPGSASRCCTASTRCTATATCRARPSSRTTSASARPATRSWSKKIGHITAMETRATGPQWAFAPCVCVARDDRWGRTYESFGETPRLVESDGDRSIDGLQGGPGSSTAPDRVLATAKHYAGDGLDRLRRVRPVGFDYVPIDQGIDRVIRAGVRPSSRSRRTGPAVQEARRRLGDAVVLQRRLDRGRRSATR